MLCDIYLGSVPTSLASCIIILSPPVSSVTASIVVESGRLGTFRVRCTSSGGRALSMSVTRSGGFSEDLDNIQAMGTPQRMGSDSFSDSTVIIPGGSDGQEYECTASNGLPSDPTGSVELRGDCWIQLHACTCEHTVTADLYIDAHYTCTYMNIYYGESHHVSLPYFLQLLIVQP